MKAIQQNSNEQVERSDHQPLSKMVILCTLSLALCFLGPFSLLASIPLSMAILLYGRKKAALFFAATVILLAITPFVIQSTTPLYAIGIFLFSCFNAFFVSEIVFRKISPSRGLLLTGFFLGIILIVAIGLYTLFAEETFSNAVEQQVTASINIIKQTNPNYEKDEMLRSFLNNPQKLTAEIVQWIPSAMFVSSFFGVWICLFITIRNNFLWKKSFSYPYTVKDLIQFRTPDYFVWPIIFSLTLTLVGISFSNQASIILGGNLLYCLGIFYFFQGFGLLSDYLTYMKIHGIFRSFLMAVAIILALKVIVLVGVLDLWINFRKFFKNNKKQGDIS